MNTRRSGAALIAAIVVLLILDCVVLGTLHTAILERRVAGNVESAVRLRLAAQSAAHTALGAWPAEADADGAPSTFRLPGTSEDPRITTAVTVERLGAALYLVTATARQRPPLHGRAPATLLVSPPPLSRLPDPAAAAITAAMPPRLGPAGTVIIRTDGCDVTGAALQLTHWQPIDDPVMAALPLALAPAGSPDVSASIDRLLAALRMRPDPATLFIDGDHRAGTSVDTVLVVSGDLHVPAGTTLRGFIAVGGSLHLDEGAAIHGAALVGGESLINGTLTLDPCSVTRRLGASGLHRARLVPGRSVIPAF
jgi:hypothetical protein